MSAESWSPAELDDDDGGPADRIVAAVRRRIEARALRPGDALPSERDLAAALGVSRGTVVRAYTTLRESGAVHTRHGDATRVVGVDRLLDRISPRPWLPGAPIDVRYASTAAPDELTAMIADLSVPAVSSAVSSALSAVLAGDGPPPGGSESLRARIADRLVGEGAAGTDAGHLTLTVGAAAGLNAVIDGLGLATAPTRDHVRGGRAGRAGSAMTTGRAGTTGTAITESPTYPVALDIVRRHGLQPIGWPAGRGGWDPDRLDALCRRYRPRLIYVQADNHNPTGLSLPAGSRAAVVEIARRYDAVLVSDETLRPLWWGPPDDQPEPLGRYPGVLTLGSLSKAVWGGLRVGWIRSSRQNRRALTRAAATASSSPSALDELIAERLLATPGLLETLVTRRRRLLAENLVTLEAGLAPLRRSGRVDWIHPTGGLTLWLRLVGRRRRPAVQAAADHGVLLPAGTAFDPVADDADGLRIAFTAPPEVQQELAARLRQAWS